MPADIPTFRYYLCRVIHQLEFKFEIMIVCFSIEDDSLYVEILSCFQMLVLVTSEVYQKDSNLLSEDFFSTPVGASCLSGFLSMGEIKIVKTYGQMGASARSEEK